MDPGASDSNRHQRHERHCASDDCAAEVLSAPERALSPRAHTITYSRNALVYPAPTIGQPAPSGCTAGGIAPTGRPPISRKRSRSMERAPTSNPVSYTHLRAHETPEHLVCRL